MLIRASLCALASLIFSQVAVADSERTFVPTSQAIHIVETIARAEGYDLSNRKNYFIDLVQGAGGKPLIDGYVTLGFYWNGDLINTVAVDEHSGAAFDTAACLVFDYPGLRSYRASWSARTEAPAALKEQTGCERFRTVSVPRPAARARRR